MARPVQGRTNRLAWLALGLSLLGCVPGQGPWSQVLREQRRVAVRDPATLPQAPIPAIPPPPTVLEPAPTSIPPRELTLDEAIRIGLANSAVVRVLAGVVAVSSGSTIYDPAISNTTIDVETGVYNPVFSVQNLFGRTEVPSLVPAPDDPNGVRLGGDRVGNYDLNLNLMQKTITGGTFNLTVLENRNRFRPGVSLLNPFDRYSAALGYTQPLLRGGGVGPNLAPVVIARINTERSYFQYKNSVQELVRGIVEAYWALVFARTDAWARRQQVEQGMVAYDRAEARQRLGFGNAAEVAQTRVALANFRATLIAAEANVLQREDALRNILGLPPSEPLSIQPMTQPRTDRVEPRWPDLLRLAEQRRPDIIELKLILEADAQSLILARNLARPQLDASALYRWNGLEGRTPIGDRLATDAGQFTDWTLGVNFSVPIGLRSSRANLRRAELVILRDRMNLRQGLHAAAHLLSVNVRNLAQFYAQYETYQITREAAAVNLDQQLAEFRAGRAIFLNVLQAISDWGNAVSSEAQALAQYNSELANLEFQTGTILETHGIYFFEERYRSIGPLGDLGHGRDYPAAIAPGPNAPLYPVATEPAEAALERETPELPGPEDADPEPPPDPLLPPALPFEEQMPAGAPY